MTTWLKKPLSFILGVITCITLLVLVPATAKAKAFGNDSVKGQYSGAFDGFLTEPVTELIPTWATTYIRSDGNGNLTSVRITYNAGGCVILDLRGRGTYETAPTGLGEATATLAVEDFEIIDPPCTDFPLPEPQVGGQSEFTFEFAVNRSLPGPKQIIDVIGLTLVFFLPNPSAPTDFIPFDVGTGSRGTLRRQQR